MKGYKMVRPDGTAFYDSRTRYDVGSMITVDGQADGQPCGVGIHIGKEPHVPLQYNATYPWRLLELEYDEKDILGQDANKLRVRKATVVRELKPFKDLGLPNAARLEKTLKRWMKVKLLRQTRERKKAIEKLVRRYASALSKADPQKRKILVKEVRFHTIKEWGSVWGSVRGSVRGSVWDSVWGSVWCSVRGSVGDSVRDSVWGSVWCSVWCSVRDSVWGSVRDSVWGSVWCSVWCSVRDSVWGSVVDSKNHPFLLELAICEKGGVFYGIDRDGIAHVVMPSKDETRAKEAKAPSPKDGRESKHRHFLPPEGTCSECGQTTSKKASP